MSDITYQSSELYEEVFNSDWSPPKIEADSADLKNLTFGNCADKTTLDELIAKSNEFPIKFPIESVRCRTLKDSVSREILEANINSTYPIINEGTLKLYEDFLHFKRNYGSGIEKRFYKDMDVLALIQRFLEYRAVSFWGPGDIYLLRSKEDSKGKWDTIGTDSEKPPLILQNILSYDEVKLSALLYVSGYTQFINNGYRQSCGVPAASKKDITENGIIIGVIGARLKKKHVMEYQDIIVTKEQNSAKNGFSPTSDTASEDFESYKMQKWHEMWANFYGEPINLYDNVHKKVLNYEKRKIKSQFAPAKAKGAYFDNFYYKKRLILTIDTLLLEANYRAGEMGKMAYIHMVGIGLGVWRNADHQEATFLDVFAQRLIYLKDQIRHIADIHFAYFKLTEWNKMVDGKKFEDEDHPNGGVVVHISKREPASRLSGPEHENKLLFVTYAWDGNAQPGNEFWMGKLKSSGDSAAASCCQVSELHNSLINCQKVNVKNLHIASRENGVLHISKYLEVLRK